MSDHFHAKSLRKRSAILLAGSMLIGALLLAWEPRVHSHSITAVNAISPGPAADFRADCSEYCRCAGRSACWNGLDTGRHLFHGRAGGWFAEQGRNAGDARFPPDSSRIRGRILDGQA